MAFLARKAGQGRGSHREMGGCPEPKHVQRNCRGHRECHHDSRPHHVPGVPPTRTRKGGRSAVTNFRPHVPRRAGGLISTIPILHTPVHGRNEPVAAARDRLDKPRRFGRVAERFAQPVDHGVQPVIEIYEGVLRPESMSQFFAGDEFTRAFDQQCEGLKWLFLQVDARARLAQLP